MHQFHCRHSCIRKRSLRNSTTTYVPFSKREVSALWHFLLDKTSLLIINPDKRELESRCDRIHYKKHTGPILIARRRCAVEEKAQKASGRKPRESGNFLCLLSFSLSGVFKFLRLLFPGCVYRGAIRTRSGLSTDDAVDRACFVFDRRLPPPADLVGSCFFWNGHWPCSSFVLSSFLSSFFLFSSWASILLRTTARTLERGVPHVVELVFLLRDRGF